MATILVVEDNRLNMELVTDLLEGAGHTVLKAFSAEEGIQMALAEPPDLILMDIRLPGMDGHAAVQVLKADPRTSRVPTVALTAQAMKGDHDAVIASGFDGYITKPIDTRGFPIEVDRLLATRGVG